MLVGAGAVGLGVASCLHKAGVRLELVARPVTSAALVRRGLLRTGILGRHRVPPGQFVASAAPAAGTGRRARQAGPPVRLYPSVASAPPRPRDLAVICVKSFDSAVLAAELRQAPALRRQLGGVLLLQNGYGNAETFARVFPAARILLGRVITGFRRLGAHRVDITVHAAPVLVGGMRPGPAPELAERFCAALRRGDLPARATADVQADLWAKLLYNAMLNPLGALLGATYGQLGCCAWSRRLMARIAQEAYAVMAAAGHRTHWATPQAFLRAFYRRMLPPTSGHESSMLQSIRAGQRTEIEALNGAIVALGRRHGIATPCNRTIVEMVHALEAQAGWRRG